VCVVFGRRQWGACVCRVSVCEVRKGERECGWGHYEQLVDCA
jgi:hypothetical protein